MLHLYHIDDPSMNLDTVRDLFSAYVAELGEDLCFQNFDEELADPLKKYGPPKGSLILAYWHGDPAGCVAMQPLPHDGVCEMKRLYIKPEYRDYKISDTLVNQIEKDAIERGYTKMVLDTLDRLHPAIQLYTKHGFKITEAYYLNPLPKVVYMEKELGRKKTAGATNLATKEAL